MPRLLRKSGDTPRKSLWQRIKDVALRDVARAGARRRVGRLARAARATAARGRLRRAGHAAPRRRGRATRQARHGEDRGRVPARACRRHRRARCAPATATPRSRCAGRAPTVILVVGVNGAGKTTFIGKLAARLRGEGKRVMVAAGDTFRAGAIDQLRVWAERTGAEFVGAQPGRRSGGGGVRRHRRRGRARRRRTDRRHGRSPAHERAV